MGARTLVQTRLQTIASRLSARCVPDGTGLSRPLFPARGAVYAVTMTLQNPPQPLSPETITALFTREDRYLCARWGRPVAPVIFGLEDESLAIFREAISAVLRDIRHPLVETDPEMGANLMVFFLRDWSELSASPDLTSLTNQPDLGARLAAQKANHYQMFRFDADGSIRACLIFLNMGGALAKAHPGPLAETMAVRAMLTFAQDVTANADLAALLRAAYDPLLPAVATDPSHGLRLSARMHAAPIKRTALDGTSDLA